MENLEKDPFNGVSLTQVDFYLKSLRNVIGGQNAQIDTLQHKVEKLEDEKKKLLTMNINLLQKLNESKESSNEMIHVGEVSADNNDTLDSLTSPTTEPSFFDESNVTEVHNNSNFVNTHEDTQSFVDRTINLSDTNDLNETNCSSAFRQPSFEETNNTQNDISPNMAACIDFFSSCKETISTQSNSNNMAVEDKIDKPDLPDFGSSAPDMEVIPFSSLNQTSNPEVSKWQQKKPPMKEKKYHCDVCKRSYTTRSNLNQHMKVHDENRGHKCNVCWRVFPSNSHLISHYKTHTGEKPYICKICGRGFARKPNCEAHEETHNEDKPYECHHCDKKYKTKWQLNKHMILHDESKVLKCDKCDKLFHFRSELQVHYRMHTGERPFPCNICGKRFTSKHQLMDHKQVHTEEKVHKCHICEDKYFKTKHQLYTHMMFHQEPKHACRYCGKKFHTSSNMKNHERIHFKNQT